MPRDCFRIAVRDFDPFATALRERWNSFAAASGCPLRLELQSFGVRDLHRTLLSEGGLKRGDWDAALLVTDWLAEAKQREVLADLGPDLRHCANGIDYPGGWTPSLLRHQTFGDAVLALPFHDGPECLLYRSDLFAAAGAVPPRTWDDFRALARRLAQPAQKRSGAIIAAFPDGHNSVYDFCVQLWSRGGELFDASGRLNLLSPAAEDALAFQRQLLADAGALHPGCRTLDSVEAGFAFARGEAAMMVNWFGFAVLAETWPESRVRGQVAIAPLPAAAGCASATLNVYWVIAAAAASPHRDVAPAFLRHCASPEGDRRLTLGGAVGCRLSTWHDPEIRRRLPFYPILETLHAGARELPRLIDWDRIAAVIDRMVSQAIDSAEPIRDCLARAQQEANLISG